MRRTSAGIGSIIGLCLVALTGCGGSQDAEVASAATRFYEAVQAQDGAAACALLSPRTRSEVEQSSGTACAEGLLVDDIPTVSEVEEVSVFGTMGQVRYAGETTYLTRAPDGWRVLAAACTPRPSGPDDCQVEGG